MLLRDFGLSICVNVRRGLHWDMGMVQVPFHGALDRGCAGAGRGAVDHGEVVFFFEDAVEVVARCLCQGASLLMN